MTRHRDDLGGLIMTRSVLRRLARKVHRYVLLKTNQVKYIRKLGIETDYPEAIHLYGKVAFGTEPWIIKLGRDVHITDGVKFITHDGGTLLLRQDVPDLELTFPIVVGNRVYFGNNAIILPGVTIGDDVIVAAGAVVAKDVPSGCVVGGVPARFIESIDDYREKAIKRSLHLGHLRGDEKDRALRAYYGRS